MWWCHHEEEMSALIDEVRDELRGVTSEDEADAIERAADSEARKIEAEHARECEGGA